MGSAGERASVHPLLWAIFRNGLIQTARIFAHLLEVMRSVASERQAVGKLFFKIAQTITDSHGRTIPVKK
jgi:hypothetical protein